MRPTAHRLQQTPAKTSTLGRGHMHAIRGLSSRQDVAWAPVLDGKPRAARTSFFIAAIVEDALRRVQRAPGLDGHAGWAVGFAYLACGHDPRFSEPAQACLTRAIDHLAGMVMPPRLPDGYPGVAWAAAHVQAVLGVDGTAPPFGGADGRGQAPTDDDDEASDAIRDVDDDVLAWLDAWSPARTTGPTARAGLTGLAGPAGFTGLDGLAGLGVYLVERAVRAPDVARAGLAQLVRALETSAIERPDGVTWRTAGDGLDLARGVPGIVTTLARIQASGCAPAGVAALAAGAVDWLRGQYPGELARHDASDLAVAIALLRAGQAFRREDWIAEACALAGLAAARPCDPAAPSDLRDGSAGRALMFQRFHHATGERRFAAAAARWYEHTMQRATPADDDSLWTGSLGVALALSAAITTIEPCWDRVLGLS